MTDLGAPHHFAYVVDDIEATVERLARDLGAGPFFLIKDVRLENLQSRGEPAEFAHDSAFGASGGTAVELIQPARLAPERVEKGFGGQRPRLQHIAYLVPPDSVDTVRRELGDSGMPEYLSSQLGELNSSMHDASALLGHDLEIHADCAPLRDFFGMVLGAAEGWDGSEPLRPVPS